MLLWTGSPMPDQCDSLRAWPGGGGGPTGRVG